MLGQDTGEDFGEDKREKKRRKIYRRRKRRKRDDVGEDCGLLFPNHYRQRPLSLVHLSIISLPPLYSLLS